MTENPLDIATTALDTVRALCPDGQEAGLSPGDLLALTEAFGVLRRAVDAAFPPVAAEVARQSRGIGSGFVGASERVPLCGGDDLDSDRDASGGGGAGRRGGRGDGAANVADG